MRHSFILNESGLKWGDTRGNNSSPRPNCTSPFITPTVKPVLLAIKCCCWVWLQGVSKVTPKLVHNCCKKFLSWRMKSEMQMRIYVPPCSVLEALILGDFTFITHMRNLLGLPIEKTLLMFWCAHQGELRQKQAGHPQPFGQVPPLAYCETEAKIKPHAISPVFHYQRLQDTVNLFNNYYKLAEL